jgi:predicted porin
MKKHLIAAAVSAAVCVPAFAQQVTVYGIMDVGLGRVDQGGNTQNYYTATGSTLVSSRLGFRGEEDLGGGLKVRFGLEAGLTPATGGIGGSTDTATNTTTVANGTAFNRDSFVAIDGSFGSIAIGKIDTSAAEGVDTFTSQIGNLGFVTGVEIGGDNSGTVRYTTPTVGGFSAQLGRTTNVRTAAPNSGAGTINSMSLQYVGGPLGIIAGYEKYNDTGVVPSSTYMAGGIRYDFGIASLGAMMGKASDAGADNFDVEVSVISLRIPMSGGLALHGAYRTSEVSANGAKSTSPVVALTKSLSKRTSIYAAYASTSYNANTARAVTNKGSLVTVDGNGFIFAGGTNGDKGTFATAGVVHNF